MNYCEINRQLRVFNNYRGNCNKTARLGTVGTRGHSEPTKYFPTEIILSGGSGGGVSLYQCLLLVSGEVERWGLPPVVLLQSVSHKVACSLGAKISRRTLEQRAEQGGEEWWWCLEQPVSCSSSAEHSDWPGHSDTCCEEQTLQSHK